MLERVTSALIGRLKHIISLANPDWAKKVIFSPDQSWDFRLMSERAKKLGVKGPLPFFVLQLTDPPKPSGVADTRFSSILEKDIKSSTFVSAPITRVNFTYQFRAYMEGEIQRLTFCELLSLNIPYLGDYLDISWEGGYKVQVSLTVGNISIPSMPQPDPGQNLTYPLSLDITAETFVLGEPKVGKLVSAITVSYMIQDDYSFLEQTTATTSEKDRR